MLLDNEYAISVDRGKYIRVGLCAFSQKVTYVQTNPMDEVDEDLLEPGGAAAILTFHSLEDRPVKQTFADRKLWVPVWKKFIMPSEDELASNPRARSAKLRASRLAVDHDLELEEP